MADRKTLEQLLAGYSEGDLVRAVEIRELSEALIRELDPESEAEQLYLQIVQRMEEILRGDEASTDSDVAELLARLQGLSPEPLEEEGPSIPDQEEGILIEDPDILFSFLREARDHLETIEDDIISLEQEWDEELVHAIFRSMHTIKGVAGFIGLVRIKELSHRLENLLDKIRIGEVTVDSSCVDLLLQGSDLLNQLVSSLEEQSAEFSMEKGGLIHENAAEIGDVVQRVDLLLQGAEAEEAVSIPPEAPSVSSESTPTAAVSEEEPYDPYADGLISPEMVQKFVEESSDLIDNAENAILALEQESGDMSHIEEAFRVIHTIKGNAGFFWFGTIEGMCMAVEGVLDTVRRGDRKVDSKIINLLLESLDNLRSSLKQVQSGSMKPGQHQSSGKVDHAINSKNEGDYKPLGDLLIEMGVASRDSVEEALELQQMKLGEILVKQGSAKAEAVEKALQSQGKSAGKGDQLGNYKLKRKDIRVDTERLDTLFDLMGELITAEAMVLSSPDLQGFEHSNFDRSATYLSKISREMQEITMSIRMIPLDGLFNKMRRLVRDLSKKFDKEIELKISGEDTEMDRNVMEEISDPLVHIIRNAIDHGIEDREKRIAAGKPEHGTVELQARYEGNEIWITVIDDGGGLNKQRILDRAVDRGLISAEQNLEEKEVYQLIFEPGFSTAETVSEISGRGVGMDVVRKNIEKLRGKIDIDSEEGNGTSFILKIPLTLAIIEAVTFTVGRQLYALPITDVIQFHKAESRELTSTEADREVIQLRGEVLPLIKIHEFFSIDEGLKDVEEGIVVVLHSGSRKAAILADEIVGYRQLVIKALPPYLGELRAVSGCSIMSDGQVSLIIDTGALLSSTLQ